MEWVAVGVGVAVLLVVLMLLVGRSLPMEHVASRAARFSQPPERVWRELVAIEALPQWRTGLKRVERLPGERPTWVEHGKHGPIKLQVVEADEPRRLVVRIADPSLPFGGGWTYELDREGEACRLTLSETGVVKPALFRFLSRFVFGYTSSLDEYLRDLGRRLGEAAQPVPVARARPAPLSQVYPA